LCSTGHCQVGSRVALLNSSVRLWAARVGAAPVVNNVTTATITNTADATAISNLSAADADGTIASYTISTLPPVAQGTLYINGIAAVAGQVITNAQATLLTFDPVATFYGIASFTFTATDNLGIIDATPALYSIPINNVPIANDITTNNITATTNTQISPLSATDLDGTITEYKILSLPTQGTLYYKNSAGTNVACSIGTVLTPAQASQLSYTRRTGGQGSGTFVFTYTATDNNGGVSNTATYSIPVAQTSIIANANNGYFILPNSAPASPISALTATGDSDFAYRILTLPTTSQGILYINGQPAIIGQSITSDQASQLTFDPDPNFVGIVLFNFTARTTQLNSIFDLTPAIYTILVYSAPEAADEIADPVLNTAPPTIIAPLSATDADGTVTSYTITEMPTSGELYVNGTPVSKNVVYPTTSGKLKNLTYKPTANYQGDATFRYAATDNDGYTSNQARYTIPVESGNITTLPVELLSFTALPDKSNVKLKWQTATEKNNDYFLVERSRDGFSFSVIGKVKGAGNSLQLNSYSLVDAAPLKTGYYRLKQLDFDGSSTYSKIVAVNFSGIQQEEKLLIYPNPTKDVVRIQTMGVFPKGTVEIEVRTMLGKLILTEQFSSQDSTGNYSIDLKNFAAGTYFITLKSGAKSISNLIVKD